LEDGFLDQTSEDELTAIFGYITSFGEVKIVFSHPIKDFIALDWNQII
jgi:hypothetical protein